MNDKPTDQAVRITEIFYSLQGEAQSAGLPTTFVRLTGCPLRCGYCDSEYAFHGGSRHSIDDIAIQVRAFGARHVCVTGGEPLAQPTCLALLTRLCDEGYEVSLETSGAMPIADVDPRVILVMDLKTPGSGEVARNLYENVTFLAAKDQIKFVITSPEDYQWAKFKIDELGLTGRVGNVWLSPAYQQVEPRELAEWILQDKLDARLQLQLHKLLWGDRPGV